MTDAELLAAIRAELAPIHERLAVIEEKLELLPDYKFLQSSETARAVLRASHKEHVRQTPPRMQEDVEMPPGAPRRHRDPVP